MLRFALVVQVARNLEAFIRLAGISLLLRVPTTQYSVLILLLPSSPFSLHPYLGVLVLTST